MGQQNIQRIPQDHSPLISAGYESLVRTQENQKKSIDLLIEGVHCAACISNIEALFSKDTHVEKARLNFTSRKLSLIWDGPELAANDFVARVESIGYKVHPFNAALEKNQTDSEEKFLLLCLGVSGFAMGNIMLLSVGLWTTNEETMGMATRDFLHWISALIALPTILFSARPFFRSAFSALSNMRTNMDVPISVGITLACLLSLFETINHGEHVFFDSAVMLIFFLLIGRYLDFRARRQARMAILDMTGFLSGFADVVGDDGKIRRLPFQQLEKNMLVQVAMGGVIPVDGIVERGLGQVDNAIITGETIPYDVQAGSSVYAGTTNMGAVLFIRVLKQVGDTTLDEVARLMDIAGQGQALYVRLADRAAKLYTPVVHTFAALTFFVWCLGLGLAWQKSLMIAISVLIITCPCALALAVPVVQVLATGLLMRRGILVKSGDALERLAGIDMVLTDKTGTLTLGRPQLLSGSAQEGYVLAASLARMSHHPLSRALAQTYDGESTAFDSVEEVAGLGLIARMGMREFKLGKPSWCGLTTYAATQPALAFVEEGHAPELYIFEDSMKADAKETIDGLQKENLSIVMISGDSKQSVESIAQQASISEYISAMTPVDKYDYLVSKKQAGHKTLMIGDGLNDAPTLAGAYVSMAPGSAIDITKNAADIVFMGSDFKSVLAAYRTAKFAQKLIVQNFAIAVVYNIIAIPVAVMGFVTPFVAAVAMSGSSLLVIGNSFRLKRLKI